MINEEILKQIVECYVNNDCLVRPTARELGMSRNTIRKYRQIAINRGLLPKSDPMCSPFSVEEKIKLEAQIAELRKELRLIHKHNLDASDIKEFVYELQSHTIEPPEWVFNTQTTTSKTTGIPCLVLSDLHFSEIVDPSQVLFRNEYNIDIATRRLYTIIERSVDLLKNHIVNPNYPGFVLKVLGDMFSGNIHEELRISNELTIFQSFHILFEIMKKSIDILANEFGRVFIVWVSGNHSRNTPKIQAKGFAYENFDWHLGIMLQKFFENDERIKFLISDGWDIQYRIYGWTFRATHGAQFRGGDGIIGPLGPICVSPETMILKTDLTYVRADELKIGDLLIGFDDNIEGVRKRRKFKEAIVTEYRELELECIEIETDNGQKTIASLDHSWLTRCGDSQSWSMTKNLKLGTRILTFGKPWERDESWESGYLSGVLDGEGSLSYSRIQIAQQKNECFDKVCEILKYMRIPYRIYDKDPIRRLSGREPAYDIRLFEGEVDCKASYNIIRLIGKLRPERLIHEKSRILWENRSVQIAGETRVIGLRNIGIKRVSGFTTSTSTFIGNGMLTHNTRGDIRKHAQARAMDTEYDFLILGHFHRQMMLSNIVVNGSIVGFNEFAFKENLPFEEPRQALWIMHPERGFTFKMDVYPEEPIRMNTSESWVSWPSRGT